VLVEHDVETPMRDGVVLRADVYRPDTDAPVPAVLNRTCYDRSFSLTPPAGLDPDVATAAGLALVCQDVRGQFSSDGEFYPLANERRDGFDSVEWVAGQPWCDGRVAMAGRSYGGATQWLAASERPAGLAAICPVATGANYFDGWIYQGGAFQLGFNLFWAQMMTLPKMKSSLGDIFRHLPIAEPPLLDLRGPARFYADWLAHPSEDDYWRGISITRSYPDVEVPAFNVGGWYDLLLKGTLESYRRLRAEGGSQAARRRTRLLVGPWAHGSTYGAYPDHSFPAFEGKDEIDLAQEQIAFLREEERPPVRIFVMGENAWRDEPDWPLARAVEQRWFLGSRGALCERPPADSEPDTYVYDPADPAPTIGGPTSLPAAFMRTNSGPMDQRRVEERADVLVYTSEPLNEPLEATGPLRMVLYAASSAPDTDFLAKLCDVEPDGFSRILAEGIVRARYRDGYERALPVEPERVYRYEIDLVATSNLFLPGHRIRVAITSSSFPRFDRNPNTGHALGADRAEDLRTATQRVFHDGERASHVVLPVVGR